MAIAITEYSIAQLDDASQEKQSRHGNNFWRTSLSVGLPMMTLVKGETRGLQVCMHIMPFIHSVCQSESHI